MSLPLYTNIGNIPNIVNQINEQISSISTTTGPTGNQGPTGASGLSITGPTGNQGPTGSYSQNISCQTITGGTGTFESLYSPSGAVDVFSGGTGNYQYLTCGHTGNFSNVQATGNISAIGTLKINSSATLGSTSVVGSLSCSSFSCTGVLTGATGNFQSLYCNGADTTNGILNGATGNFTYLNASQPLSALNGINTSTTSLPSYSSSTLGYQVYQSSTSNISLSSGVYANTGAPISLTYGVYLIVGTANFYTTTSGGLSSSILIINVLNGSTVLQNSQTINQITSLPANTTIQISTCPITVQVSSSSQSYLLQYSATGTNLYSNYVYFQITRIA
jgi:hypothetical protein